MNKQKKAASKTGFRGRSNKDSNGEFVALEQRQCVICGKLYETGNLLLDKKLRGIFENKYACAGYGICPEHQKYIDDGYVICLEVSNAPTENDIKPEDAQRTGNLCFIRKESARAIFKRPIDSPVVYLESGIIEMLKNIFTDAAQEVETGEISAAAREADCASAV